MADGVKKRHSRWVLKAHYVLRDDLELSGICVELLGFGKRARLTTYAPEFRDNAAPLAVANRAQWAEVWPFPEIGWSVPNNGEMQDVHLIPQETPDRDVFSELDQLRTELEHVRGVAESALQPATKEQIAEIMNQKPEYRWEQA